MKGDKEKNEGRKGGEEKRGIEDEIGREVRRYDTSEKKGGGLRDGGE
ncbi:MAG: hypothetical protein U5N53_13340 [Mycobacterium sp.]|nr:hypothetical protein [Mycobacterium sp.]